MIPNVLATSPREVPSFQQSFYISENFTISEVETESQGRKFNWRCGLCKWLSSLVLTGSSPCHLLVKFDLQLMKWSRLQNQIGGKKDCLSKTELLHVFMYLLMKKFLHGILKSDYIYTSSSFTTWVWQACHVYRTSTQWQRRGCANGGWLMFYTSVTSFIVKRTTRNDKSRGVSGRPPPRITSAASLHTVAHKHTADVLQLLIRRWQTPPPSPETEPRSG